MDATGPIGVVKPGSSIRRKIAPRESWSYTYRVAICVRRSCGRSIDGRFAFCPYCGADNRPPETRPPIRNCAHQDVEGGGFCVLCGESLWDPSFLGRSWRLRGSAIALALGLLSIASAGFLGAVHSGSIHLFADSIEPWYRQAVHVSAYTSDSGVWQPAHDELFGDRVCSWLTIGSPVLGLLSLMLYWQPRTKRWEMSRFHWGSD